MLYILYQQPFVASATFDRRFGLYICLGAELTTTILMKTMAARNGPSTKKEPLKTTQGNVSRNWPKSPLWIVAINSSNALATATVCTMATALPSPAFSFLFSFLFSSGECPGEHRNGCILPGEGSMEPWLSGSGYRSVYL